MTERRSRASGRVRLAGWVLAALLVLSRPAGAALTTDVITLNNGDRVTGEVLRLSQGILSIKTNQMGTLSVEWPSVAAIASPRVFWVRLLDGRRLSGSFTPGEEPHAVLLVDPAGSVPVAHDVIVEIAPLGQSFWKRLTGSLSLGASYAKATETTQINFNSQVSHRTEKFLTTLRLDTNVLNTGGEGDSSSRYDASLNVQRFLANRWFYAGGLLAQGNEELGVDLRVLGSAIAGRYLVESSRNVLAVGAGFSYSAENDQGSDATTRNAEGVIGSTYSLFIFDAPDTRLSASVTGYLGITQSDRFRLEFSASGRREIFPKFFLDLSGFYSYDSKAPPDFTTKSDSGVTLSLGWSF